MRERADLRETQNEVANSEGGDKEDLEREMDEASGETELEERGFGQIERELEGRRDGFGKRRETDEERKEAWWVGDREGESGLSEGKMASFIFRWPGCLAMTRSLRAVTEYHIGFTCQHCPAALLSRLPQTSGSHSHTHTRRHTRTRRDS